MEKTFSGTAKRCTIEDLRARFTKEESLLQSAMKHLRASEEALLEERIVEGFSCQLKARVDLKHLEVLLAEKAGA
jgi:hypothetical protein